MDPCGRSQAGSSSARLPPSSAIAPAKDELFPALRRDFGRIGHKVQLLTNHFNVRLDTKENFFYLYNVNLTYDDNGNPVTGKSIGRRVMDKVLVTYVNSLQGKGFAYDGEHNLFTLGSLAQNLFQLKVVLDDVYSGSAGGSIIPQGGAGKRMKRQSQSKTIKVQIRFAAKIPIKSIVSVLRGQETEHFQEAINVLDVVLRDHAAKKGCLLVRQSFFKGDKCTGIGGGALACHGFYTSFRATQGGLTLNVDASTTVVIQQGPVMDFLLSNQNVRVPQDIDWNKAKRTLKNLRVKVSPSGKEGKITGLSERICREQTFMMKRRNGDGEVEVTVYEYFVHHRNISLGYSADFPCINIGKPKHPNYVPIEFCELVSLQRYTKALSVQQRASIVETSRKKPRDRMKFLIDALRSNNYDKNGFLCSAGISIYPDFTRVEGRVLPTPKLICGNNESFVPRNGRWNFNNKRLWTACKIEKWAVVNFSFRCNTNQICETLMRCGNMKGVNVSNPLGIFEEDPRLRRSSPFERVDSIFKNMENSLSEPPMFILCILPERKNSDIYGPWKRKCLSIIGIVNQCIVPTRVNDQYMTNVLLKINAKLGGLNSILTIENKMEPSFATRIPTMIFGMDVSHGPPGRSDIPSIAAVVGSTHWPCLSRYRASVRNQSPRTEMIASLFMPSPENKDNGIIRELLQDFCSNTGKRPEQIIIFRDGVAESQFSQVLNIELDQIMEACKFFDEHWNPRFLLIVAQKIHHTKFFQAGSPENVQPGTIVDNQVCHPNRNDFYLCAHAGMIGTTRPTHYYVLYDELNFHADELQGLVHSLCYVYQRSTTAVSLVAPICYAHLAAAQMGQFIKFDEASESASSHGGVTSSCEVLVPELPRLNRKVQSSMFFV
ncbi:hypothetical protein SAY87_025913 [Trapa incisa]|uniref:Uncharacterized protein n=1 Tax=Trapa incisa TaxID=236973 RepID=A0AAN7GII5_9MYRT|nr:hypothetical protein SAY87_025913 [Trapa incisa]